MNKGKTSIKPTTLEENIASSYDEMPYESLPFSYTRPEHLRTIGLIFGMNPPAIETARVLELGCAAGGNLYAFAENYPKAKVVGIDLSKVQIEDGQKMVKELGLKNLELKHMSITDIDASFGEFDYIITHGIFSWVPDFVKDKILEISKKNLSPNGISYISYNTLPGWNMVGSIRDMMIFHSSMFQDVQNKVQQARLFLDFINDSLDNTNTPYANFLKSETEKLKQQTDTYIRHEYLEDNNHQFYFHEFANMAKKHGLSYLGESNLHSMYIGNLPKKAAEKLSAVTDIVRSEQYMDFVTNRRFRCTLLCHDNIKLDRNITYEKIRDLYTTFNIVPEKPEDTISLSDNSESISFYLNGDKSQQVSSSSPIMKAILYTYSQNIGNFLTPKEISKLAMKKLNNVQLKDIENELSTNILKLIFAGYIRILADKPKSAYSVSAKPKTSLLAQVQAKKANPNRVLITNQLNEINSLQIYEKYVLEALDGKHSKEEITKRLIDKINNGELVISSNNNKITDPKDIESIVTQAVDNCLEKCRTNFLLVD